MDSLLTFLRLMLPTTQPLPKLPDSEIHRNAAAPAVIAIRKSTLSDYLHQLLLVSEWRTSAPVMHLYVHQLIESLCGPYLKVALTVTVCSLGMLNTARNQERRAVVHLSKLREWCGK